MEGRVEREGSLRVRVAGPQETEELGFFWGKSYHRVLFFLSGELGSGKTLLRAGSAGVWKVTNWRRALPLPCSINTKGGFPFITWIFTGSPGRRRRRFWGWKKYWMKRP